MINDVVISGIIEEAINVTDNLILATLNCDGKCFYLYWGDKEYQNLELRLKYVIVKGSLEYIKVRAETNGEVRRILAIFVKGMEKYDF